MRNLFTLESALVFSMLFSVADCVWAVPITGGTGPGGVGKTDGASNLILWLDAANGVSETDAVGRVSNWADQSGYGNSAAQTGASNQPNYIATSINGRPGVQVLSTGSLHLDFPTMTNPASNYTFFFAIDPGTIAAHSYIFDTTGTRLLMAYGANVGGNTDDLGFFTSGSAWKYTSSGQDTNPQALSYVMDAANGGNIWRNGTQMTIASANNDYTATAITSNAGIGSPGTHLFNGDYGEMAIFNSALDSVERTLVENYMAARFAMTISNDHYSGDTTYGYEEDVFGIGQEDSVAFASSGSAGFGIEAVSGLDTDDEFLLAGHSLVTNSELADRWARTWYVDNGLGGNESLTLAFDWSDAGLGAANPEFTTLLFSATEGGPFSTVTSGSLLGDTVTFAGLSASSLIEGFYTLGAAPPVPEPSSFLLLGLGALGFLQVSRRRKKLTARASLSQISTDPRSETMKTRESKLPRWSPSLAVVVALGAMLFANLSAHAVLIGSSASNPGISAKQILDYGASLGDGVYWIDPDGAGGNAPFQAYADMTTDGGGWTLMTYAGTIPTTKTALAGADNWFPVFSNFGTYDFDALSNGNAFSRRDMVDSLFQDSSQILSYRSSNLNNQMIFPVADRTSWLGGILPDISFLTLTNDGTNYVTHPGSELDVFNQAALPQYTGYDWNVTGNNSDGYGSYATALNHRSLLYWERLDNSTYDQQWFHGTPLSMAGALGPVNDFQDIAFFLREDVTYTPPVPEPSSLLLLGLGALGMLRHARRRRRRA